MEKRGLLLYIPLIIVFLIKFVKADTLIPGVGSNDIIGDTLGSLGIYGGRTYAQYGQLIDFILVLVIFISLARTFLKQIDTKASTAVGIIIAFGFAYWEYSRIPPFKLGDLGFIWAIIFVLIIGAAIFRGFNQTGVNFNGFVIAYLISFIIASMMLGPETEKLGFIWGWLRLIFLVLLILGIVKFFGWIMKHIKGSEDIGEFSEGTGKMLGYGLGAAGAAGKGLGKAAGGLWKGGKKNWSALRDAQKLRQIDEQSKKLDTLINNVDDQLRALNVAELKNARERMELLTNIRALASIRSEIIIKFRSKNPEVLAKSQELNEKFKQASSRLDELIKRFYSGLSSERQRILDETRLNASEIKFLDAALRQEINTTKTIFNELKSEVDYIAKTTNNHDIQNRFNDILKMRNNMRATILNVIELIKGDRSKNIKMLKQLNDEDIRLAENLKRALLSSPDSVFQYIDGMMQNLGREITLINSDSLKNNEISRLRRELKTYYDAISSLDSEVTEYIQKLNATP